MKKFFFLNIILGIQFFIMNGQTIPNGGFENWSNQITYDTPDDWGTTNPLTSITFIFTATKATGTDKHTGNSAIKLETKNIFGQTAPGIAVTGTVTNNPNVQAKDFKGIPINFRPVGLSGWFKYTPGGTDTGSAEIFLFKWNSALQKRDEVGSGSFEVSNSVTPYTNFIATIDYVSSDIPDTAVIILLSGSDANTTFGSTLFIDDLSYVTCSSVGITVAATDESAPGANDGSVTANLTIGATPYSYSWNTGDTTQTISGLGAGNFCVTASDGSGCIVTGCDSVGSPAAVGISSIDELNSGVYPNPVSSNLHVTATANGKTISLFDSKGSRSLELTLKTGLNRINISNLKAGVYFYQIQDANRKNSETGKLIINN